jgi:hypothetical protein
MTAPRTEIVHKKIYNPGTSGPLVIPILVLHNTPEGDLLRNIRVNSARDLPWVGERPVHDKAAILVGGGASVNRCLEDIHWLKHRGGIVYAMNAASQWLRGNGIEPDYQVIADAKPETATLVDPRTRGHLFASQVNPTTFDAAKNPVLWHLGDERIEAEFPEKRRKRGGYSLIGGGASVGNSAMCLAYVLGHRELHIFGFDSCHWNGESHAYPQPMNRFIPTIEVEWAGREFTSSVAMKAQAEKFQITAQMLKAGGCKIEVYGDGLLQHMYRTPPTLLTERDRYRVLWQSDSYREVSPGEFLVGDFEKFAKKPGPVIDFGCGTGRAALRLRESGYSVICVDFADNCRDDEALSLPFLEWDLSKPCPLRAPYGFCTDVMEHIPPNAIDAVIQNIVEAAVETFFQISTVPDSFGPLVGGPLHLTVRSHAWWKEKFKSLGLEILTEENRGDASVFMVRRAA